MFQIITTVKGPVSQPGFSLS